tara:strand:- start:450 stop:689 length:240 start_codon:yes stop_codon:yes gene_type:complete
MANRSLGLPKTWDAGRYVKIEITQMPVIFLVERNHTGLRLAKLDNRVIIPAQIGLPRQSLCDVPKELCSFPTFAGKLPA